MKSAIKGFVALLLVLGMAAPAMAEDRLSLTGSLQVRGQLYSVDRESGTPLDKGMAWNDMRMRIGGKIAVAEGVSVNFRFDTSESSENSSDPLAWGAGDPKDAGNTAGQYSARRADIQFDKAYLQIDKFGGTLMAGQLYFGGFSSTQSIMDYTAPGFIVKYGDLTIAQSKRFDENQGNDTFNTTGDNGNKFARDGDSYETAAMYKFKADGFTLTPAVSYNHDESTADYDLFAIAVSGTANAGPVALKGEVDFFDGEFGPSTDLKGLQLTVNGSIKATDIVTVGANAWYAAEQNGSNEMQVYNTADDSVTDWGFVDYNPQHYGSYSSDFVYTDKWSIWDPSNANAGVIAGQLYADVKASDSVDLKFAGMYYTVADDKTADVDGYTLDAQVAYKVMANTSVVSHLNYMSQDDNNANTTDKYFGMITGLTVTF